MSAYASLPGSFLPPFFAFGAPGTSSENNDGDDTSESDTTKYSDAQSKGNASTASTSSRAAPSSDNAAESTFKTLSLSSGISDDSKTSSPSASRSSSPSPSDIIIAIRSARVDTVALIKNLTSRGSTIARRTANLIVRTPDMGESSTASESSMSCDDIKEDASVFSRPGLCYEDSDSDEEYSMYDYSDDFSTPNDDHPPPSSEDDDGCQRIRSSCGDPSAIEFELSITFQGRKYNATRAFPSFVKLRNDLLREFSEAPKGGESRRSKRGSGGARSPISIENECAETLPSETGEGEESVLVPELPSVSPESLGHVGFALSGVARSGFALLQATANHYCPAMEGWMRQVIDAFPCSQSLSNFVWEPLASSSDFETIGEDNELRDNDDSRHNEGYPLSELAAFAKPPRQSRSKSRSNNTSARFKRLGSYGSLCSIDEGSDGIDCDDHSV